MLTGYADEVVAASANFGIGIVGWIIIGGLAGWVASKFMGTDAQQGIFLNIIVGIVGGWLGGFLVRRFLHQDTQTFGLIATFVTALVGACILLAIVRLVSGRRR
ncbi:GlsB/YeaQ/YmgE family stress response membrane protein [Tsukamurella soli]|uniref:GlsB/YeaQ/YmgE family stress response membrane protein n=1 Tax=Tsukamurella soli TaxID=644556 RepID=A0ABP8KJA0_9ACTN